MTAESILVATDDAADADVVMKLLAKEFRKTRLSCDAERAVADFEAHRPAALVLAFNALEKAERYCLGLYRLSSVAHTVPHGTIVLCTKDELRRAYDLCRKSYFDDYVLFWPANHDAMRLPMAVHQALRRLSSDSAPTAGELAVHARSIAGLAPLIERHAQAARERADRAGHTLKQAIERVKGHEVERHLHEAAAAVEPVRQLASSFQREVAPTLATARTLSSLAERVRPLVLIVEDDDFQRRLLERMLIDTNVDTAAAPSGTQALSLLRMRRPDLVLMDVNLPDMTGVEATRRLKAIDRFAAIPVIMITGQSERSVVLDSVAAGAADFIVKPIDKGALIAKVRERLAA